MAQRLTTVERKQKAQEDILEAAAHAIATHGFHGMSMRELAKAAGRSLANFYNHFGSKEEVLLALQVRAFETLIATAEELQRREDAPSGHLYMLIANHVAYFQDHPDIMRVLLQQASALGPEHRHTVRVLKERYFEIVREAVAEASMGCCTVPGAAPGAPDDPAELERRAYSVFGMMNWVFGWYEAPQHGTVEDVARTIHQITMCGVVTHCPMRGDIDTLAAEFAELRRPSLIRLDRPPVEGPSAPATDDADHQGEIA